MRFFEENIWRAALQVNVPVAENKGAPRGVDR